MFRGQHYTEKADCYSYGVLVWELFTQKYPFNNLNPRSAAFQQSELGLRPPITPDMNMMPEAVAIIERAWQADPEARMPFRDIVLEWEKLESARFKVEEQALPTTPVEGAERRRPMTSSCNEYVFTPLEFRKLELEQRLLRRPSIFQLIQKDIIPQESANPDGWGYHSGEDDTSFHSLLGYDLMKPSLMAKHRSAISIGES